MATKSQEMRDAERAYTCTCSGPDLDGAHAEYCNKRLKFGCLAKAADDEPLFILRAQDVLAPAMVRTWVEMARILGTPQDKLDEAETLAEQMLLWRDDNPYKVPD